MFKTNIAQETWRKKYQYNNETPIETQKRIAKALASVEEEPEKWENLFLNTLVKFDGQNNPLGLKCTPGGRITANIGTEFNGASLLNCYGTGPVKNATIFYERQIPNTSITIPIIYQSPSTGDNMINIVLTLLEQALTLSSEGGWGINASFIRPRGSLVKTIGVQHPGVIKFLEIFDKMAEVIVAGNNDGYIDSLKNYISEEQLNQLQNKWKGPKKKVSRKGACMVILNCDHPDIEEFILAKQKGAQLTKFNMSILLTDKFLKAVENNENFELKFDGVVYKVIKAKQLYDLIMTSTYNRNEPGVLFYDNMQKNNPVSYLGDLQVTNPCVSLNMRVLTEEGYLKAEELLNNKKIKFPVKNLQGNYENILPQKSFFITRKNAEVFKMECDDGSIIECTSNHEFPLFVNNQVGYIKTKLKDLKLGDKIYLGNNSLNLFGSYHNPELAYLMGYIAGDGTFKKPDLKTYNYKERVVIPIHENDLELCDKIENNLKILFPQKEIKFGNIKLNPNKKQFRVLSSSDLTQLLKENNFEKETKLKVPEVIFKGTKETIAAYLQGLYDADGGQNFKKGGSISIQLTSTNKAFLQDIKLLLSMFNIRGHLKQSHKERTINMPDGQQGKKEYNCKACFRLDILGINTKIFIEEINFSLSYKTTRLLSEINNPLLNKEKWITKIKTIEFKESEDVCDFTVPYPDTQLVNYNGIQAFDCGEIPINPETTTTCLLGSINVTQYVLPDRTFDWKNYKKDIITFARMLDNVIELQNKDLPAYLWATKNLRQYGMGITGFGSMLYMLGVAYNSPAAILLAEELNRMKLNLCLQTSALLANEKGKAPMFDEEKYFSTNYWKNYLKGKLDKETIELIKTYGIRNLKQTTNPPSGNTSVICDNISNGLEPVFMHNYERTVITEWPEGLTKDNIKTILKEIKIADVICWRGEYNNITYYYEPHNRGLCQVEVVYDYGYRWVLEKFPKDLKNKEIYMTTNDLKVESHVDIQVAFQKYIDQSVSKTCGIPKSYPFSEFKELYLNAWKNGLIGFTTYRDGTMESVLSKIEEKKDSNESHIIKKTVKLPEKFINGPTHVIKREHMKFYLHFSYLEEDKKMHYPIALWIQTNHQFSGEAIYVNRALKSLSDLLRKHEISESYITKVTDKYKNDLPSSKIAKLISMCLRHNLPISSIIAALENLEGDNISSLLTAIRKFLSMHIEDGTKAIGKKCLECQSPNVIYESGCTKCLDCGNSNCG